MRGNYRDKELFRIFALAFLVLCTSSAIAQGPFREDDWIAWGDARSINDLSVGQDVIYVATGAGIHRYDRYGQAWLTPWFSVPLAANRMLLLQDVVLVREDPLSHEVYARLRDNRWVRRGVTADYWEIVDPPGESLRLRLSRGGGSAATPNQGLIAPLPFQVNQDGSLSNVYVSWKFSRGIEDELGPIVYAWKGFGFGTRDRYSLRVDLFPAGPGPSPGMDVTADDIWCAGRLDRHGGWVWHRDRSSESWEFFDPDYVFGLEPANVQALKIGPDNTVWLATSAGVMFYQDSSWQRLRKVDGLPTERVLDVAPFSGGAWIATSFGLAKIDGTPPVVFRPDPETSPLPASNPFTAVVLDSTTLYAAGNNILLRKVGEGLFDELDAPPVGTLSALFARDQRLAVGGTNGFAWLDGEMEWSQLSSNLWHGGAVFAIDYNGGFWWLGTDRGLVKIDPKTKGALLFGPREGLPGSAVYSVHGEGDWLWLGTDLALVRFRWNSPMRSE